MTARKDVLEGTTSHYQTKCGKMYITLNEQDGNLNEVIIKLGKAGCCARAWTEFTGKLITHHLRNGLSIKRIIKQLDGIQCADGIKPDVPGCQQVICDALKEYTDGSKENKKEEVRNL